MSGERAPGVREVGYAALAAETAVGFCNFEYTMPAAGGMFDNGHVPYDIYPVAFLTHICALHVDNIRTGLQSVQNGMDCISTPSTTLKLLNRPSKLILSLGTLSSPTPSHRSTSTISSLKTSMTLANSTSANAR